MGPFSTEFPIRSAFVQVHPIPSIEGVNVSQYSNSDKFPSFVR